MSFVIQASWKQLRKAVGTINVFSFQFGSSSRFGARVRTCSARQERSLREIKRTCHLKGEPFSFQWGEVVDEPEEIHRNSPPRTRMGSPPPSKALVDRATSYFGSREFGPRPWPLPPTLLSICGPVHYPSEPGADTDNKTMFRCFVSIGTGIISRLSCLPVPRYADIGGKLANNFVAQPHAQFSIA